MLLSVFKYKLFNFHKLVRFGGRCYKGVLCWEAGVAQDTGSAVSRAGSGVGNSGVSFQGLVFRVGNAQEGQGVGSGRQ